MISHKDSEVISVKQYDSLRRKIRLRTLSNKPLAANGFIVADIYVTEISMGQRSKKHTNRLKNHVLETLNVVTGTYNQWEANRSEIYLKEEIKFPRKPQTWPPKH